MRWAVIDANEQSSNEWSGITSSVVGQWLKWEVGQAPGAVLSDVESADGVFLVFSGSIGWLTGCRRAMKRASLEPVAAKRDSNHPIVITGGPIDASPRSALKYADALTIGEGYRSVRAILKCTSRRQVESYCAESNYILTRAKAYPALAEDTDRPWLTPQPLEQIVEPDPWVDWGAPDVKSDDKIIRVVASKGCHMKCGFCATTYRQAYQRRDDQSMAARVEAHVNNGERVQLLSNDPLNIPGFNKFSKKLDHASLTVMELMDDHNLLGLVEKRPKIVRVGMEGVSAKVRKAFGKPITSKNFVDRLSILHKAKVNTHSFWITHAPYEQEDDWGEWVDVWQDFSERVDWGLHRAKMTCFIPAPPAPLSRYLPATMGDKTPTVDEIKNWRTRRTDLRRVLIVAGGQSDGWLGWVAEQFGIEKKQLPREDHTVKLADTFEDWTRMPAEIVRWPLKRESRYKVGEVYRRKMGID